MQLNFSCMRQLQNPKFLIVRNFLENKNPIFLRKKKERQKDKQEKRKYPKRGSL